MYKKSVFSKSAYPKSLSPLGHSVGFASCKARCVLISSSLPNPHFPRERLCMLGWLCIVQSLWAYTPGVRAGAVLLGLPPLIPVGGFAPATPFITKYYSLYLRHIFVILANFAATFLVPLSSNAISSSQSPPIAFAESTVPSPNTP